MTADPDVNGRPCRPWPSLYSRSAQTGVSLMTGGGRD
jgi:hypothetical protein